MEDDNEEKKINSNDFFSSPKKDEEKTINENNNVVSISEDVNPLTTDINKVNQTINSEGVVGKKIVPRSPKFYISMKSFFNKEMNDDELLSLYVGNNYGKISQNLFNPSAIVFGPFYYMFRKMFMTGLLIFVGLLFLHHQYENYIVDIVFYLAFGLIFNILYLSKAIRKTNKIKTKYSSYDNYTLGRMCTKKGGRSIFQAIFGFIICVILFFAFCIAFYLDPMTNFLRKFGIVFTYENKKIDIRYDKSLLEEELFDDKYGFYLIKSDIPAKKYLKMNFENTKFINISDNSNYKYVYTLGNDSEFDACKVELYGLKGYSTSEKFIEAISKTGKEEYSNININNIKWYYIKHSSVSGTAYYYSTMVNGKVFVLRYFKDNTGIYDCLDYSNEVIRSVTLK